MPTGGVLLSDVAGDGFGAGAGVALEGADRGVAGAGEEHGVGPVFGGVGDGGVPELVEGPAGVGVEEVGGTSVSEEVVASPAGREGVCEAGVFDL